jgi:hypothetical protein
VAACIVNPGAPGCTQVLPTLTECRANAGVYGCAQVLALSFQACLANPNDPGCSGVLPTISQCVNQSSQAGCEVVLPTLAQCIGSPTLQGCSVRLPSLAACAASPSTAGCEAVLPQPNYCVTHPSDPTCTIFSGNGGVQDPQGKPVAQAVQDTVHLINRGTSQATPSTGKPPAEESDKEPGQGSKVTGPAQTENTGAKNEKPATKMYCN